MSSGGVASRRLRALVIVPTRDLAVQVKAVFDLVTEGSRLRVGIAAGQQSFWSEQEALVARGVSEPYVSLVDILVATPGRLVDHIDSTEGFSMSFLRFLVVDEADRLMNQAYYNWLEKTLECIQRGNQNCLPARNTASLLSANFPKVDRFQVDNFVRAEAFSHPGGLPLQKLLFSATLTKNPEKLNALRLWNPVYLRASETGADTCADDSAASVQFSVPSSLQGVHVSV